jgi:hypothetical protein
MSYPPISPDGAWIQIAIILGRMEQKQADQARSLDTLIRILQEQRSSPPALPEPQPLRRSMLGVVLEKIASKVSTDMLLKLGGILVRWFLPYLLPGLMTIIGLATGALGAITRALLRLLGLL